MPVIQLGPLALPIFPLAVLLGGWLGLEISARLAHRLGVDGDHIYNSAFFALAVGLVTARLAHVVAFWPAYRAQPLEIIGLNTRAFLPLPALIAALAAWSWYVYRRRLPWQTMLDAMAPGLLFAAGVAHIGAFVAGRNPGAAAAIPWAVTQYGVSRHPVQLYEACAALAGALFTWRLIGQARQAGSVALTAIAWYGLSLWLLVPFHADSPTMVGGLLTMQVIGLAAGLAALWLLSRRRLSPTTD